MEMESMSGAIHLKQANDHTGIVYFKEGKLAGCSEYLYQDEDAIIWQQSQFVKTPSLLKNFARPRKVPGQDMNFQLVVHSFHQAKQLVFHALCFSVAKQLSLMRDGYHQFWGWNLRRTMLHNTLHKVIPNFKSPTYTLYVV